MFFAGDYPRTYDGLAAALSLDMCVVDPAWVAKKLIELGGYREPQADLWAPVPGRESHATYPSTVAYVARLILHRYTLLGVLDAQGNPTDPMGAYAPERPPQNTAVNRGRAPMRTLRRARGGEVRRLRPLPGVRRDRQLRISREWSRHPSGWRFRPARWSRMVHAPVSADA